MADLLSKILNGVNMFPVKKNADKFVIEEYLLKKEINDTVTYNEIINICVEKNKIKVNQILSSVIQKLHRQGVIFHNIRNIGYKRANDTMKVIQSPLYLKSARNKLKKANRELKSVDSNNLSNELKIQNDTMYAMTNLMLHLSKQAQVKQLEQKAITNTLDFNPMDNLKYLTNS